MIADAARTLDDDEPETLEELARVIEPDQPATELPADFKMLPEGPPLTALEIKYLLGNASREEAAQVRDLFAKRSKASPDGVFVCGFLDDP